MENEWNGAREIAKPIERQREDDERAATNAVSDSADIKHLSAEDEGGIYLRIHIDNAENKNEKTSNKKQKKERLSVEETPVGYKI